MIHEQTHAEIAAIGRVEEAVPWAWASEVEEIF